MAPRYERVNARDDDDDDAQTPTATQPRPTASIPNSPPPSFYSRASSVRSRGQDSRVDTALADAFDAADDSDDDEADDRQRLVRGNSFPVRNSATTSTNGSDSRTSAPQNQSPQESQTVSSHGSRVYGSGIQSDGVFSNLTAKPERSNGEKEEQPPTYEQAAADAAPPYWETTILAPGLGGPDEVFVDGMPVGSFFSFLWNAMISMSFQLVGFLLTYLLHSTHAAKNGSRAGLGITLIQYGFYMKGSASNGAGGLDAHMNGEGDGFSAPSDPNSHDFDPSQVQNDNGGGGSISDIASSEWAAYALMIVGWFILIRASSDYVKARRHEQLVLQSPDRGLPIPIIAEGETVETVV